MNTKILYAFVIVQLIAGCGGVQGARPGDMSQNEHQSTASQEELLARQHGAQYNPSAMTNPGDCMQYLGSCWGENPTEEHREQATGHQHAAAAHRAAAATLAAAEARSCRGVPDADRDISPFFHREAIVEVKPFSRLESTGSGLASAGQTERSVLKEVGATIVLLPAVGVTAERLQRTIECHLARNAALGYDVPEMPYCPLVLKGVTATVTSAGNAFAVNIDAPDSATAAEVLRRARALSTR
jgi:hypothetical protein